MIQINVVNIFLLIDICLAVADEFNSCGRQSRARHFMDIPCSLTNDITFCASAGSYYPWQSLIQFVNDNRSLMRRMYGETRQSVLLRHELKQTNRARNSARSLNSDQSNFQLNSNNKNKTIEFPHDIDNTEGVNACPSQVEVVSPYWANSTRGDLVAILNVYPFEQFVYFEKCVTDPEQVFCRNECRCEQQFGLQRLLAFDPQNECRGIFSEWFRFPMCCVCRCYVKPNFAAPIDGEDELHSRDYKYEATSIEVNSTLVDALVVNKNNTDG